MFRTLYIMEYKIYKLLSYIIEHYTLNIGKTQIQSTFDNHAERIEFYLGLIDNAGASYCVYICVCIDCLNECSPKKKHYYLSQTYKILI